MDELFNEEVITDPESLLRRAAESELSILGTEKYLFKIYSAHLNGDDSLDYIATINLRERAVQNAINKGTTARQASLGYMGNYNYIIFLDGASKSTSSPVVIPSSALSEVKIIFENIRTESFQDLIVEYKIMNGGFRFYFAASNSTLTPIFQHPLYDHFGEEDASGYVVELKPGTGTLAKDIHIIKAKVEPVTFKNPEDVYSIEPKLTSTGELERIWYYSDQQMKYYTKKD